MHIKNLIYIYIYMNKILKKKKRKLHVLSTV